MPPRTRPALEMLLGRVAFVLPRLPEPGMQHHFVRDYARLVRRLKADYRLDDAMSLAVGGGYAELGEKLADVVLEVGGLKAGERLVDFGCGSGRLPAALSRRIEIDYTGIDIIPDLLAYARTKSPPSYRFILNRSLALPLADATCDLLCAFSLFTHLKHEETFVYLGEARRVLRPGGRMILSFLEFAEPTHWPIFERVVTGLRAGKQGQADVFLERSVIAQWAERLQFLAPTFVTPGGSGAGGRMGQSLAVLRRPADGVGK